MKVKSTAPLNNNRPIEKSQKVNEIKKTDQSDFKVQA